MLSAVPADTDIQFASPTGRLHIEKFEDPNGNPVDVLDKDVGLVISGWVTLPSWLSGTGLITLAADEIGGPFDKDIGSVTFPVKGGTEQTGPSKYDWSLTVNPLPVDDEDKMYRLGVVFVLRTLVDGHTDIGGFYDLGTVLVV